MVRRRGHRLRAQIRSPHGASIVAQAFTQGASNAANTFQGSHLVWDMPAQILGMVNTLLLFGFLARFPTGRLAPRWMAWVLVPALVLAAAMTFVQPHSGSLAPIGWLFFVVVTTFLVGAQIYRYRRVSTALQRQQTKWVVFRAGADHRGPDFLAGTGLRLSRPGQPTSIYFIIVSPIVNTLITPCAVAFAFAILRYRLYDIDVIIRRTLVYGSLTLILAGVYIAGVVGVQSLVSTVVRRSDQPTSPVLIVITTLLIAALFQPLRRALQRFIDRRFYHRKYDSRTTLEVFSTTLRQEVDLSALTGQLVAVVSETMQPEHVSLWLRGSRPGQRVCTRFERV